MELGLCLSGGGVKGAAHIGAIKALEEAGICFKYIGGTSSGSIVSTLYAVRVFARRNVSNYETQGIDYLLEIRSKNISLLDFNKIDELYNLGYEITKKQISKIKNILNLV